MKYSSITDDTYNTLESLLDKTGDFNTALSKNENFRKLKIYADIINGTRELDVFKEIKFKHRFEFLKYGLKIRHCVKCGKPFIFFPRSGKRFSLCPHRQISDKTEYGENLKRSRKAGIDNFIETTMKQPDLILDDHTYDETLRLLNGMKKNYAFIPSQEKYRTFYHDLIVKTERILPFERENFRIPERIYLQINGLNDRPKCRYCGKNETVFVNRIVGYNDSCGKCSNLKLRETKSESNRKLINENFDFEKYEITQYPRILSTDPLLVKCRKCGNISEWYVKDDMTKRLKTMALCRHCEHKGNWEETEFHEYLEQIYSGKIVHGKDGRKTIPPYELDEYLPDVGLAFEYNGLYWHDDEHVNEKYHLNKTVKCAELGIKLIHIFSNEWIMKGEITRSRVKNLLGIYDYVVYARKCEVKKVENDEAREFQEKNHIQGAVNSKVKLGLYNDDGLIALMTFGKCRFDGKHEWEMLRFCCKLGYHIPGGAGKLMRHFERTYAPKSIVTYADRRWSDGGLYKALGFDFVGNSVPNYWYFKPRQDILMSRVRFQKHRLKNILEKFDSGKTEVQNMKDNGYKRIFDCGNMVFEKIY